MYENKTIYLYAQIYRKYNNGLVKLDINCLNSLEGSLLATTFQSKTMENKIHISQNACLKAEVNRK